MNTQTIFMCVVALLIGMLVANMLQNVCGCKKVEGFSGGGLPGRAPNMTKIDYFIKNNQRDSDACGGLSEYSNISDEAAEDALKFFCSQENVNADGALQDFLNDDENSAVFGTGECTALTDTDFDSSCISSGLST